MDVNEIQIGGKHYRKDYQHWDFALDTNMHYLIGCATKYPTRWKEKNGTQDLRKSIHYLSKAIINSVVMAPHFGVHIDRFCDQFETLEASVIKAICENRFKDAIKTMEKMIMDFESLPTANYADPDNNYIRG